MVALVKGVSTLLSSLSPGTPIFTLYFLLEPITRLAAVMGFTMLFSLTLFVMTKVRTVDIFAATTASVSFSLAKYSAATTNICALTRFAAVQAVFVGGSALCSTQSQCPWACLRATSDRSAQYNITSVCPTKEIGVSICWKKRKSRVKRQYSLDDESRLSDKPDCPVANAR